ncbi:MAG: hypothetical protein JST01_25280 [Cyanobacteria bacterium SZAS TMP-1]|nr:hypothetical protein [Cyanobacteria bacterium SZAS TMP-1]
MALDSLPVTEKAPPPQSEGWLQHAVHEIQETCEKHPTITTIAAVAAVSAVAIPTARFGIDYARARIALAAETEIQTAQPFRSLINIGGYGSSKFKAVGMESIIAGARNSVISGDVTTGRELEQFIAKRYLPDFRKYPLDEMSRSYDEASLLRKHFRYAPTLEQLAGPTRKHIATATIEGQEFQLVTTWNSKANGLTWLLPRSKELNAAARTRIDKLFDGLLQESGERSPSVLNAQMDRVAEMEWLNAQTWKYSRGSAGISQLESRTWMELAGIDSGKYRAGIDPNLEALSRSLPDFKQAYPSFFKTPPTFFQQPRFNLVPRFEPELILKAA